MAVLGLNGKNGQLKTIREVDKTLELYISFERFKILLYQGNQLTVSCKTLYF